MYRASVKIKGIAPLSQSRKHGTPFLDRESHEDYEERTWREKTNHDDHGVVFIPAMAFKQAVDAAAKRLQLPDPDNRRATLTKFFTSDVICEGHVSIGVNKGEIGFVSINANADGVRGSGKRVRRKLPQCTTWEGETSFLIMDEKIKPETFRSVLDAAGRSVGVGQFRPEKGGMNGRFEVVGMTTQKL